MDEQTNIQINEWKCPLRWIQLSRAFFLLHLMLKNRSTFSNVVSLKNLIWWTVAKIVATFAVTEFS